MPHVVTHAMNTNEVMHASCDMDVLASWPSLGIYHVLEVTYWPAICAS